MKLPWMSRADRRLWHSADTLKGLGNLTASWLLGDIASQPGYQPRYGPDEETQHLIPVLADVNRLGFLTDASQPGCDEISPRGYHWVQRAAVSGLIDVDDEQLRDRLLDAARKAGLSALCYKKASRKPTAYRGITVTTVDGEDYTAFGGALTVGDLETIWPEESIGRRAFARVVEAWQLTIVDEEWGRGEVLWEALAEVVRQYRLDAVATAMLRAVTPTEAESGGAGRDDERL